MSHIVLLIGHERSGTNLLGSILCTHHAIRWAGEVCNTGNGIGPTLSRWGSFFSHKVNRYDTNPYLIVPTVQHQYEIIKSYFDSLQAGSPEAVILLDIKYGHIHNFDQVWASRVVTPCLFDFVREEGIRVIHLYRRDTLSAVCSNLLAVSRRLWNTEDPNAIKPVKLSLDVEVVQRRFCGLEREKEQFAAWLPNGNTLTVTYEDLISNGHFNPAISRKMAKFLRLKEEWDPAPKLLKVSPPLAEYVENLSVIRRRIKRDRWRAWLRSFRDIFKNP